VSARPGQPRSIAARGEPGAVDHAHPGQPRRVARAGRSGEVDQVAVALGSRQGGVFGAAQLRVSGVPRGAVEHRLLTGRWVIVHRGVYAIAGVPLTRRGRGHAALLAGGPDATLSHRWAGADWALRPETMPPEITVPGPRRRSRPDLVIHTQPPLEPADIRLRDGLRVTSPERTLLDLAGVDPPAAVEPRRRCSGS
jgi:hypothetical protein